MSKNIIRKIVDILEIDMSLPPVDITACSRKFTGKEILENQREHEKYNKLQEIKNLLKE
jgi:hypothetical protein